MSKRSMKPTDPMRGLALLWGSHTEPGRSGLTIRAIVTAAMEITNTGDMDALSMRKVAERLGVGTMSLYTHIPGKAELIELMLDTAYGQVYTSVDEPSQQPGGWQAGLRFIAERNWNMYRQHNWMLQISSGRPVLGPNASLKYEAELRPLDNLGLSDVEMDAALTLILTHVEGCARAQTLLERNQRDTGITDAEWWVMQAPLLDKIIDSSLFPVGTRVGTTVGNEYQATSNPELVLKFGLDCILIGIDKLISSTTIE